MANNIRGITVEIGGSTVKLNKALEDVTTKSKDLQSELRSVDKLLKLDPSNTVLLSQKQDILKESINATKQKLEELESVQDQITAQYQNGDIDKGSYDAFQREIITSKQKLEELENTSKEFGGVIAQVVSVAGEKVQELGGKIETAGKNFSAISSVATAGLVASAKSAMDTETAINKYIGSTGKAVTETDRYKEVMENIYQNNYGESIEDVANKMTIVSNILGDLPDNQLQSVVEKSYMLEDAYGMDFQENIRGVNALMDQFGITSDQAYELINQGAQKGLNQNQDLTDQIAEYSTYYAKLGFTAEDFFNMMISGAEDGAYQIDYLNDAMKEFGIRTKDNSTSTNDAYKALGLNAKSINKEFAKGGESAQKAFSKVTKAIMEVEDPVKRNEIGVALFGTKFEDLEESAVFAMSSASEQVDMLGNSVEKTSDIMYDGTANKSQEALRSIQTSLSQIGSILLTTLAPVIEKIAEMAKKFGDLNPTIQKIILIVTGLVASLAPVLIVIGKVVSAVGKIMTYAPQIMGFITKIKGLITGLFTFIGAHPIIAIITAIIAVIILLWNKCEWFRNGVMNILNAIVNFFKSAWEQIKAVWELVAPYFMALWENIKNTFTPVITSIINFFKSAWEQIKAVWDLVAPFFKAVWELIKAVFSVVGSVLSDYFKIAWTRIKLVWDIAVSYFTMIWNNIKAVFSVVATILSGFFKVAWTAIKATWNNVVAYFQAIWNSIKAIFSVVKTVLANSFAVAWIAIKAVWDTVTGYFRAVWNTIKGIFSVVKSVLSGDFKGAWEAIKGIVSTWANYFRGVWNSIKSVFSAVVAWFRNVFSSAWGAIKSIVGSWGNYFRTVWNGIKSVFSSVVSWFRNIFSSAWNAIKSIFSNVGSFFSSVISKIKNAFTNLPSQMKSIGKNIIDGLTGGIKSKVNSVVNAVKDIGSKITGKVKSILGIASPSRVMKAYGQFTSEGLAIGIKEKGKLASDAMGNVVDDVINQTDQSALMNLGVSGTPRNESSSNTVQRSGDTIINFNGNYNFKDKNDIDYFMNEAGLRLVGVR